MKITIQQFEKLGACPEGIDWLKAQKSLDLDHLIESAIKGGMKTAEYTNWGIVRLMDKTQKVRYAVYAAERVLEIYETKYPKDDRPRKAIEAAKKWVKEPTEENRKAASAADADASSAAAAHAAAAASAANRLRLFAKILRYGVKLLLNEEAK